MMGATLRAKKKPVGIATEVRPPPEITAMKFAATATTSVALASVESMKAQNAMMPTSSTETGAVPLAWSRTAGTANPREVLTTQAPPLIVTKYVGMA